MTITVTDVNEAPMVTGGPTRIRHPEGNAPIDINSVNMDVQPPSYTASDPEDGAGEDDDDVTLSLEGADAGKFNIDTTTAWNAHVRFQGGTQLRGARGRR